VTLDVLERLIGTLAEKMFYGAHQKNLNEGRPIPIPSAAKCRSMIPVSRNIRYVLIFENLRGGGEAERTVLLHLHT